MHMNIIYRVLATIIDIALLVVEIFLGLRFILKLLGANPATPFVDWVYDTSLPLLGPFLNIFPSPVIDGQFVLEFTTLFAIVVYALIAYLIQELLAYVNRITRPNREEVKEVREVHHYHEPK